MMKRDTAQLWEQIEKVVGNLSVAAKRDTMEQVNNLNPAGLNPAESEATAQDPALPPAAGHRIDSDQQNVKPKE